MLEISLTMSILVKIFGTNLLVQSPQFTREKNPVSEESRICFEKEAVAPLRYLKGGEERKYRGLTCRVLPRCPSLSPGGQAAKGRHWRPVPGCPWGWGTRGRCIGYPAGSWVQPLPLQCLLCPWPGSFQPRPPVLEPHCPSTSPCAGWSTSPPPHDGREAPTFFLHWCLDSTPGDPEFMLPVPSPHSESPAFMSKMRVLHLGASLGPRLSKVWWDSGPGSRECWSKTAQIVGRVAT